MEKNFVVYKSSAGSGKTFTLVKEYLKLALGDPQRLSYNFKRILALTFTNKAAAEMRIRIVKALTNICDGKTSELDNMLCKEMNLDATELKNRANTLLNYMLHHYSDFAVSTIDSFSHKIVKTFAHDLGLSVNFNLEMDTGEFYNKVIANLINEIGNDKAITDLLKEFVLNNLDDEQSWDPEKSMQEFAKLLQKESSVQHVKGLASLDEETRTKLKEKLHKETKAYRDTIKQKGQQALDLIEKQGLSDDDFNYKKSGPQGFFRKCAAFELDENNSRIIEAIEKNKWQGKDIDAETKAKLDKIIPELNKLGKELLDYINENKARYTLYDLINKRIYPILLLNKIQSITNELKDEEQLVFIEEFNTRIFDLIKNEPVSFIYERLGDRYKNFLLDEFQDTSTLQWQNILPLVENSLAEGHFNLLVGDGKQSIYRWRNANVKQFALLPELENTEDSLMLSQQQEALKRNYKQEQLNVNYRSRSSIIEFNNSLFENLSKTYLTDPLNRIYEGQAQEKKNNAVGLVTIMNDPQPSEQLEDFVLELTLKHVNNSLQNGYSFKHICILTNSNKKGSAIANFLSKKSIPVISNDSLLLNNCPEINTLAAFYRYIQNGKDAVSASVVLNYLLSIKKISLDQFHKSVSSLNENGLYTILENLGVHISETELQTKNLLDLCIYLIERLGMNQVASAGIYLRFFLDEVSKFMSTQNSNVSEFNAWWEKRSQESSLIISEDLNAVKIMTIHKSKGLEFPIVIIPFCNWDVAKDLEQWVKLNDAELPIQSAYLKLGKSSVEAGFSKEAEVENQERTLDNINKLYVAFTRAVDELHIISSTSTRSTRKTVDHWLRSYLETSTLFKKKEDHYEFGAPTKPSEESKKKEDVLQLHSLDIKSELRSVQIKGSFLNGSELVEGAKQKGIVMHYVLSNIKHIGDIDNALQNAILEGLISIEEQKDLKDMLLQLIQQKELSSYFDPSKKIFSEKEILMDTGEILRPDRIVISEHETCIIDYKTGKENTAKYAQQMKDYQWALEKMGFKNIKKLLVYIENFKVIEVY
jgi:ATP-dependent exoDNAse (exonuclease V) beta subunit